MTHKIVRVSATIIILLLGVTAVLAVWLMQQTDTKPVGIHNPLSPEDKEQVNNIQATIEKQETPTATPEDKIGETDPALQNEMPASPDPKTKSGKLTYHAELLETNPVKALRLQTEELGSWTAEWIPHSRQRIQRHKNLPG